MSWQQRVEEVKALVTERPHLEVVFDAAVTGASERFISELRARFPLPDEYLAFLRTYDGIQLDMYVLFGSGESSFPALLERRELWRAEVDLAKFFPFAEDASGDAFCFDKQGSVVRISRPNQAIEFVTTNFEELLSSYFMGEKFLDLFPKGRTDSEWYSLLVEKGWCAEARK